MLTTAASASAVVDSGRLRSAGLLLRLRRGRLVAGQIAAVGQAARFVGGGG